MPPNNPQAEVELALRDGVSGALKQVGQNLEEIRKKATELGTEGSKSLGQLLKDTDEAKKAAISSTGAVSAMHGVFTTIGRNLAGPFGVVAGLYAVARALDNFNVKALELNHVSINTRLTVESLNRLTQAARFGGLDLKSALDSTARVASKIGSLIFTKSDFYDALVAMNRKTLGDSLRQLVQVGKTFEAQQLFYDEFAKETANHQYALAGAAGGDRAIMARMSENLKKTISQHKANVQNALIAHGKMYDATLRLKNAVVTIEKKIIDAFLKPKKSFDKIDTRLKAGISGPRQQPGARSVSTTSQPPSVRKPPYGGAGAGLSYYRAPSGMPSRSGAALPLGGLGLAVGVVNALRGQYGDLMPGRGYPAAPVDYGGALPPRSGAAIPLGGLGLAVGVVNALRGYFHSSTPAPSGTVGGPFDRRITERSSGDRSSTLFSDAQRRDMDRYFARSGTVGGPFDRPITERIVGGNLPAISPHLGGGQGGPAGPYGTGGRFAIAGASRNIGGTHLLNYPRIPPPGWATSGHIGGGQGGPAGPYSSGSRSDVGPTGGSWGRFGTLPPIPGPDYATSGHLGAGEGGPAGPYGTGGRLAIAGASRNIGGTHLLNYPRIPPPGWAISGHVGGGEGGPAGPYGGGGRSGVGHTEGSWGGFGRLPPIPGPDYATSGHLGAGEGGPAGPYGTGGRFAIPGESRHFSYIHMLNYPRIPAPGGAISGHLGGGEGGPAGPYGGGGRSGVGHTEGSWGGLGRLPPIPGPDYAGSSHLGGGEGGPAGPASAFGAGRLMELGNIGAIPSPIYMDSRGRSDTRHSLGDGSRDEFGVSGSLSNSRTSMNSLEPLRRFGSATYTRYHTATDEGFAGPTGPRGYLGPLGLPEGLDFGNFHFIPMPPTGVDQIGVQGKGLSSATGGEYTTVDRIEVAQETNKNLVDISAILQRMEQQGGSPGFPMFGGGGGYGAPGGGGPTFRRGIRPGGAGPSLLGKSLGAEGLQKELGVSAGEWDAYRQGMADIESSGGKYGLTGGSSGRFSGAYQFGAQEISDTAKSLGETPPTRQQFLSDPAMQERYMSAYTMQHHQQLMKHPKYAAMSPREKLVMLGYAHNQGVGGALNFLTTGRAGRDAFGTSGTAYGATIRRRLSELDFGLHPGGGLAPASMPLEAGDNAGWRGGSGGRFNVPAGSRMIGAGESETVTLSNGTTFVVNSRAAAQFKGFYEDLIAAGAPVHNVGGVGSRARNPSQHPIGLATDWAQSGRGIVSRDVQTWMSRNQGKLNEIENKWGMSGGEHWANDDTGHFSIDTLYGSEHLKKIAGGGVEDKASEHEAARERMNRIYREEPKTKTEVSIRYKNVPAGVKSTEDADGGISKFQVSKEKALDASNPVGI